MIPANCTATLADVAAIPGFALRRALLLGRQSGRRKARRLQLLPVGHARVRHRRSGESEGDRVLQAAGAEDGVSAGFEHVLPHCGQNTFDHTADWSSANSRFVWHGNELHLWMTSQDNGFQVLRFTNGVGLDTTLPKAEAGAAARAGRWEP